MIATRAPRGLRGFDANTPVTYEDARAFIDAGYRFAVRYVRRVVTASNDLSAIEFDALTCAGLAVMPVQHVESAESWSPTDTTGRAYGRQAGLAAHEIGITTGTTVWLDLEGVATDTKDEQIIRYCNYWHDAVAATGFQPGIYVGWHSGLTPAQLYGRLKFTRYWGAYNLNADQRPATCGVCMQQSAAKHEDRPRGVGFGFDINTVKGDALGRFPMMTAPDEWDVGGLA